MLIDEEDPKERWPHLSISVEEKGRLHKHVQKTFILLAKDFLASQDILHSQTQAHPKGSLKCINPPFKEVKKRTISREREGILKIAYKRPTDSPAFGPI